MIIGLTGGIGSGKSTVARLIRTIGFPVYDADQRGRYLQTHDRKLIGEMADLLGEDIFVNNQIDRKKVAERVFGNPDLLEKLNQLVHPRVKQDFEQWVQTQQAPLLFKESALLVETGSFRECDALVFVKAPESIRIARVMARDDVTEEEVKSRIDRQMSDEEKAAVSDYTVVNDDRRALIPQVEKLIDQLLNRK